ncbi:DUF5667 domain-containing protein [Streptosporangium sp. NBC_01756]|uniref:DUF5667 domain-containing protein n=1 Tax=Streptosporangium sp. NBC_01756 TaxID=2975950 RepID=UPI002DDA3264|nr:DUF5667 domain-containing protein [Streptosporangium sp. NBC_01756]WSC83028.1 DUF5667 domain-containing protein [Streptosporangium sp. NBC_01756]
MGKWLPGISRRSQARIQNRVSMLGIRMGGNPRPEFRSELRERLMDASEQEDPPIGQAARTRPRPRPRFRLILLPQFLSLSLAATTVMAGLATYRSTPGDTLYPLKRAAESTLFHLSTDDAERAGRSFDYAETRAHEVEELLGSTRRENYLIKETLQAMEDTTRSAVTSLTRVRRRDARSDAKSAGQLKRFVQKQRHQIEGMLPKMDVEEQRRAHDYLNYIDGLAPPG